MPKKALRASGKLGRIRRLQLDLYARAPANNRKKPNRARGLKKADCEEDFFFILFFELEFSDSERERISYG